MLHARTSAATRRQPIGDDPRLAPRLAARRLRRLHAGAARARAVGARRAATPVAELFDDLGKIVDYNTKYFSTALAGLTDSRTAAASHILFGFNKYDPSSAEGEAAALKAKIAAGEISFADAAVEYSTCPSKAKGGDLGTFKRGAMVPEFDAVCFDVDVPLNGLEGPVKTQFGYHLIQVRERSE